VTTLELRPTAMAAGGDAIARDASGRVVFVDGALPDELVRAELVQQRKDFARAVVTEIVEPSPDRQSPSHDCGACTWQHIAVETQRRLKRAIVVDALRRIAKVDVAVGERVPEARPVRTTARLGVDAEGRAGFRRKASHDVVAAEQCPSLHPRIATIAAQRRFPGAAEVLVRIGSDAGDELVIPDPSPRPKGAVHDTVGGRTFRISAGSFFQPGPVAAAALVDSVREALGNALSAGGTLIDAYAGVGLFASIIGAGAGAGAVANPVPDRIIAIESSKAAAADARVNLADLAATIVLGEVADWKPGGIDASAVVADPSRTGLGRPGVTALAAAGASRIVLVSCDPASMARDTALLGEAGYRLVAVETVDCFPDTFHIEAVSRFDLS